VNSRIAITWQSFALFSFVSVIAVPLAMIEQLSPINFIYFCVIGSLSTLVLGFLLFSLLKIINPWLLTLQGKNQEHLTLIIITFAGAVRGVFVYWGIAWSGFNEPTDFWTRIGTSTTTTLLWFTLTSLIVSSTQKFKLDYRVLVNRAIVKLSRDIQVNDSQILSSRLDREFGEIEGILHHTFKDKSLLDSKESLFLGAKRVLEIIEEKIRPLSHRLWLESSSSLPKIKIQKIIPASIQNLEIPPAPTTLFLSLGSIINVSTSLGWQRGLSAAIVIVVEVYLLLKFFESYIQSKTIGNLFANGLVLLVPGIALSGTFYLINRFGFSDDIGPLNLIYAIIFPIVAVLASAFQLTQRDRAKLLLDIENSVFFSELVGRNQGHYLTKNAASYLHNSLQSELLSISRQLELSATDYERDDHQIDLEALIHRLNSSIRDDFYKFLDDPLRRLGRLPSAWKGIAEIEIDIPSDLCENKGRNLILVQIIEEEIANAVRHSNATAVTISANETSDHQFQLSIVSNGHSSASYSTGLGAEWFDHHAPNTWKRELVSGRTKLVITI
jgi:hypothetical protein